MLSLLVKYCVHWKCNNNRLKSYKAPLAECSSKNAKLNSKFSRTKPKLIVALKTDNEIIFKNIQNFATQTWQRQCQSRKQTQSQRGSLSAFETPFTLCVLPSQIFTEGRVLRKRVLLLNRILPICRVKCKRGRPSYNWGPSHASKNIYIHNLNCNQKLHFHIMYLTKTIQIILKKQSLDFTWHKFC